MKKIVTLILSLALAATLCHAQFPTPKQTDTLEVVSMEYNYQQIDRQNWPFSTVFRTPDTFVMDYIQFPILSCDKMGNETYYVVQKDGKNTDLKTVQEKDVLKIYFCSYILSCREKGVKNIISSLNDNKPVINLPGRYVQGQFSSIPTSPDTSGTVTVDIYVDPYGKVKKASINRQGTTIRDSKIEASFIDNALGFYFNMNDMAPAQQHGTIIYSF